MRVLEAQNVDLIEPFPVAQVKRLRGWLYCYKTLMLSDADAQTPEEFLAVLEKQIQNPNVRSWGVIDKNHQINNHHEAPLVGFLAFERSSLYTGYVHVASSRSAWGTGFIDEACRTAINEVFNTEPELLRMSAAILVKNSPAKALIRRLNFDREGILSHLILQNGEPQDVVHYGLTRERWKELCQLAQPSQES